MKTVHIAKAFTITTGTREKGFTEHKVKPGIQLLPDDVADHWFTKAHLADGGFGAESYAQATRAAADNAYHRAKDALALYIGQELAARDAEIAAGGTSGEPAFERFGPLPDPLEALTAPVNEERKALDEMSDQELREFIKARDGKFPHPATSREKLMLAAGGDEAAKKEIESEQAPPAA